MRHFRYFSNFTVQTFFENSIKKYEKHCWSHGNELIGRNRSVYSNRSACLCSLLSCWRGRALCRHASSHGRRLDADVIGAEFVVWNAYYSARSLRAATLSAGLNRRLDAHIIEEAVDAGVYHSPNATSIDRCRCRRVALRSRVVSPQHYRYSNQ